MKPVRKAIIPAAGMGTRFLPATKSVPKEMLPIVDKPVIQFVIEEAAASGITDILLITSRSKTIIEDYLDRAPLLESFLDDAGKADLIPSTRVVPEGVQITAVRQQVQAGLGDAVRLGRSHIGDEPFAILLGDTIIDPAPGAPAGTRQLIDRYEDTGGSVVAVRRVPSEWTSRYGIVDGQPVGGDADFVKLDRLVEKPAPEDAPTDLAIAGRYVFTPDIFDHLENATAGVGGEIQLTDAMNALAQQQPMFALAWRAHRYDIGNRADYAKCFLDYALRRTDTAPDVLEHIKAITKKSD